MVTSIESRPLSMHFVIGLLFTNTAIKHAFYVTTSLDRLFRNIVSTSTLVALYAFPLMLVALVSTRAESGKAGGQNPNNGRQVRNPHAKSRVAMYRSSDTYRTAEHEDGNMRKMLVAGAEGVLKTVQH